MKKLGKLTINPEKAIKNEELVKLKGGYSECVCVGGDHDGEWVTCNNGTISECCGSGATGMNCV